MLVIENPELGKRIEDRAAETGKTVEEYLESLYKEETKENDSTKEQLPFFVPKLDWREHIKVIDYDLENEDLIDDKPVFQDVEDSVEYVRNLRNKEWKQNR